MCRINLFFVVLASQIVLSGCHLQRCHTLWNNVCRTVKREPKCFDYCDRSEYFRELACKFWCENMSGNPGSEHFRAGFTDGFADYLRYGGDGLAPVLPPRRYWEPSTGVCRLDAIEQWKSGFQVGSEAARESGLRDQIVMPYDGLPVSDMSYGGGGDGMYSYGHNVEGVNVGSMGHDSVMIMQDAGMSAYDGGAVIYDSAPLPMETVPMGATPHTTIESGVVAPLPDTPAPSPPIQHPEKLLDHATSPQLDSISYLEGLPEPPTSTPYLESHVDASFSPEKLYTFEPLPTLADE